MTRGVCADPNREAERRRKLSIINTGNRHSDLTRKRLSVAKIGNENGRGNKGKHHPPKSEEVRMKLSLALNGNKNGYKNKSNLGKHLSEDHRRNISNSHKGKYRSEEHRRNLSDALKGNKNGDGIHPSELTRRKRLETFKGGFWYGNVTYPLTYCELFTEKFKERVRAYFGYICPECLTTQNGKRLCVHHVHYDKKTCCKEGEMIGDRQFIPLCTPCHTKTNGKREYWEQHFTNMINGYYQGKSYFTEDEMTAYSSN